MIRCQHTAGPVLREYSVRAISEGTDGIGSSARSEIWRVRAGRLGLGLVIALDRIPRFARQHPAAARTPGLLAKAERARPVEKVAEFAGDQGLGATADAVGRPAPQRKTAPRTGPVRNTSSATSTSSATASIAAGVRANSSASSCSASPAASPFPIDSSWRRERHRQRSPFFLDWFLKAKMNWPRPDHGIQPRTRLRRRRGDLGGQF